jgi:hypothetical protein
MLGISDRLASLTDYELSQLSPEDLSEIQSAVWMEASEAAIPAAHLSMRHFRTAVLIETPDGERRPYESVLEHWQRPDVEALDSAVENTIHPGSRRDIIQRFYYERARGHSKTTDQAILCLGIAYSSDRTLTGVVGSGTKDQAALLRRQAEKIASLNPWIASRVEITRYSIKNKITGTEIKILTSDESSNYGETPDVVIVDELTVWKNRGLWDALFSAVAKVPHCFLVVISNAGRNKGVDWQWEIRELARKDPAWRFRTTNGSVASWITPLSLAEQRRFLLPSEYRRVWENEWQTGSGDALERSMIDAVFDPAMAKGFAGKTRIVSLDLGIHHDHASLVATIVDAANHRYFSPFIQNWRPQDQVSGKVDLREVRTAGIELVKRLQADVFVFDPWQADLMASEIAEATGVDLFGIQPTPKNSSMIARRTFDVLRERRWQVLDDEGLRADLEGVVFSEKPGRGIQMILPKTAEWGHADRLAAASMGIAFGYEVSREVRKSYGITSRDEGELSGMSPKAA